MKNLSKTYQFLAFLALVLVLGLSSCAKTELNGITEELSFDKAATEVDDRGDNAFKGSDDLDLNDGGIVDDKNDDEEEEDEDFQE